MSPRTGLSVLVVDDHDAGRYALARSLRAAGYAVQEASTGAAALELAGTASAVLLDVHLPDLQGPEVCRLLRARPDTATMPIVHVSAQATDAQAQKRGREAGADAYLVTPVDPQELAAVLDRLLKVRG